MQVHQEYYHEIPNSVDELEGGKRLSCTTPVTFGFFLSIFLSEIEV